MTQFLTFTSAASPTPSPKPVQPSGISARVATQSGSLNLRQAPNTSASVLRTIPRNDMVSVQEQGAEWCRVAYDGTAGYVMTRYLIFSSNATSVPDSDIHLTPLSTPLPARIMSTSGSLNLRDGCSLSARVLLEMPKFDMLLVTALGDTWCAVLYEGHSGYCMTKYLEFTHE